MKVLSLMRRFNAELYLFVYFFSTYLKYTPTTQLAQDKICKFKYNQSDEYCIQLSKVDLGSEKDSQHLKNLILTESAQFSLYATLVSTLPSLFLCLVLGSWCDNYIDGRKILMIVGSVGVAIETIITLFFAIQFNISKNFFY